MNVSYKSDPYYPTIVDTSINFWESCDKTIKHLMTSYKKKSKYMDITYFFIFQKEVLLLLLFHIYSSKYEVFDF